MEENQSPNFIAKSKSFLVKCRRVWAVLRKPTKEEFNTIAKVSAIGLLVLGALGFSITLVMKIFV